MKSLFIFFSLFAFSTLAQQPLYFYEDKGSPRLAISLITHFEGNTSSLPNSMIQKLLFGGEMSPEFLTKTRDKLNTTNRFGFDFLNEVKVKWTEDGPTWVIGTKFREVLGLKFSRDLFGVAFLGNAAYEGREANFSKTQFQYWQYTGVSFGYYKEYQETMSSYLAINGYYGSNYQQLKTSQASLFTAVDGAYLRTQGSLELTYRQPSLGLGLGVSGNIKKEWGNNLLYLSIEDIGFINWSRTAYFEGNTNKEYKGYYINDISSFTGDSLFSDFTVRGFGKRFGVEETEKSKLTLMPFYITGRYQRTFLEKWKGSAELFYTYMPAYVPRLSLRVLHMLNYDWEVGAGIAYGGFGKQNLLLSVNKTFSNKWTLQFESYFLGMAFLPEQSKGLGLNFGIQKKF